MLNVKGNYIQNLDTAQAKIKALTDHTHIIKMDAVSTGQQAMTGGFGLSAAEVAISRQKAGMSILNDEMGKQPSLWQRLTGSANAYGDAGEKAHKRIGAGAYESHNLMQKLGRSSDDLGLKFGGLLAQGLLAGGIAGAGLAIKGVIDATGAAQNAQAALQTALKNTGQAIPNDALERMGKLMENLGHDDADTKTAIATLTTGLGSSNMAMSDMNAVADLAAKKHKSLADAATLYMQATMGNARALKELGISAPIPVASMKNLQTAQEAVDRAEQSLQKTMGKHSGVSDAVAAANKRVYDAQVKYQEAVTKYGTKDAPQAVSAHIALEAAMDKASKTASKGGDAVVAAQDKVRAAQEKLAAATDSYNKGPGQNNAYVHDQIERKLKGLAQTQSGTLAGSIDKIQAKFTDLLAKVGQQLTPVIQDLAKWFAENADTISGVLSAAITGIVEVIKGFVAVVKFILNSPLKEFFIGLTTAVIGYKVAMGVAKLAQDVFTKTNPMLLAVGAIIAIVILLIENWDKVKKVAENVSKAVSGFMDDIRRGIGRVIDWVKEHWPLLLAILTGPIGLAVLFVVSHFDQIKNGAKKIVDGIVGFFKSIPSALMAIPGEIYDKVIKPIGNFLGQVFGDAGSFVVGVGKGIANTILGFIGGIINGMIDTINSFQIHAGPVDWNGFGISHVNLHLAQGGIVTGPTNALIGEGGEPEAVVPLSKAGAMGFGGGGTHVHIDLRGSHVMNDQDMDRLLQKIGDRFVRTHLPNAAVTRSR